MMSATARAQRRGAISQMEFRAEMHRLGFIELRPSRDVLHRFAHPRCLGRLFVMRLAGETYSRALERLSDELRTWGGA